MKLYEVKTNLKQKVVITTSLSSLVSKTLINVTTSKKRLTYPVCSAHKLSSCPCGLPNVLDEL